MKTVKVIPLYKTGDTNLTLTTKSARNRIYHTYNESQNRPNHWGNDIHGILCTVCVTVFELLCRGMGEHLQTHPTTIFKFKFKTSQKMYEVRNVSLRKYRKCLWTGGIFEVNVHQYEKHGYTILWWWGVLWNPIGEEIRQKTNHFKMIYMEWLVVGWIAGKTFVLLPSGITSGNIMKIPV